MDLPPASAPCVGTLRRLAPTPAYRPDIAAVPAQLGRFRPETAPVGRSAGRSRCQGLERWNGAAHCPTVPRALGDGTVGQPKITVPRSTPQGLERWNGG